LPDEPASAEEAEVESRNKKESGEKN